MVKDYGVKLSVKVAPQFVGVALLSMTQQRRQYHWSCDRFSFQTLGLYVINYLFMFSILVFYYFM